MPILEISSNNAPKDLNDFTKRMNALFADLIGKPETVSVGTKEIKYYLM
jgi:phenylpyruvate tautomerase